MKRLGWEDNPHDVNVDAIVRDDLAARVACGSPAGREDHPAAGAGTGRVSARVGGTAHKAVPAALRILQCA